MTTNKSRGLVDTFRASCQAASSAVGDYEKDCHQPGQLQNSNHEVLAAFK
jgi:hypothetical protein